MRTLLISIICIATMGCKSLPVDLKSETHRAFLRDHVLPALPGSNEHVIVLTINQRFCGACTAESTTLLHASALKNAACIVVSDLDTDNLIAPTQAAPLKTTSLVIPIEQQQRKGFFSTMNRIYLISRDTIEYANYITDGTIRSVHRELNRWERKYSASMSGQQRLIE